MDELCGSARRFALACALEVFSDGGLLATRGGQRVAPAVFEIRVLVECHELDERLPQPARCIEVLRAMRRELRGPRTGRLEVHLAAVRAADDLAEVVREAARILGFDVSATLNAKRELKMARSAHAFVRGSTQQFYD